MSLREEMWKYEQITGESAEHVPIIKLGAFLDGYEMGLKALERQLRDCKTCKHSNNGNCAGTEECHECMWESKYEQQSCEDCISREYLIDKIGDVDGLEEYDNSNLFAKHYMNLVKNAPSVQPKIEVSEDCISRVETLKHSHIEYDDDGEGHRVVYVEEIKDLPSVTPQQTKWIPCSERLPEVGSEVLVCFDFKGNRSVYISDFYGDGEFHGLDDEYLTPEGRKCRKAVAWMPLPQPYKAESEEE